MVCSRMATKASCSLARASVCAWTLPVATHGTPRRSASAARPRLSTRSWRWKGRCSSTRKASRPKARSSRRMVGSSRTPWRAQPLRQTRPSAWASTSSRVMRGSPTTREVRVAEPRTRRGPSRRGTGRSEWYTRVWAWARVSSRQRLAHPRASRTSSVRWRGSSDVSSVTVTSAPWMGRRPTQVARGLRELHRARDRVVVGEGQRGVPALQGGGHQLVGQRGAVQEGEGGVAVELDVRHANACSHGGRTECCPLGVCGASRRNNSIIEGKGVSASVGPGVAREFLRRSRAFRSTFAGVRGVCASRPHTSLRARTLAASREVSRNTHESASEDARARDAARAPTTAHSLPSMMQFDAAQRHKRGADDDYARARQSPRTRHTPSRPRVAAATRCESSSVRDSDAPSCTPSTPTEPSMP